MSPHSLPQEFWIWRAPLWDAMRRESSKPTAMVACPPRLVFERMELQIMPSAERVAGTGKPRMKGKPALREALSRFRQSVVD